MNNKRNIACAIVGSNNVGKHCLLNALTSQNTEKQRCDKVDWLRTTSINFNEKDYTIKLAILRSKPFFLHSALLSVNILLGRAS